MDKAIVVLGIFAFFVRIGSMKDATKEFVPNIAQLVKWFGFFGLALEALSITASYMSWGGFHSGVPIEWMVIWSGAQIAMSLYLSGAMAARRQREF